MKRCTYCQVKKPTAEFGNARKGKPNPRCRKCASAVNRAYRLGIPPPDKAPPYTMVCPCGCEVPPTEGLWEYLEATDRTCSACGQTKPLDQFYVARGAKAENTRKRIHMKRSRHSSQCISCASEYKREKAKDPEYQRAALARSLRFHYDLSVERYDAMLVKQRGLCAICGKPPNYASEKSSSRKLNVDHNHETGKVRGLLCGMCNRGVGLLFDNPVYVAAALAFLLSDGVDYGDDLPA